MRDGKRRVLYVQKPSGGGSMTGLLDTVRALDADRFEPVVLFYRDNRYRDAFRELGAEVRVLNGRTSARPLPGSVKGAAAGLKKARVLRDLNSLLRREWPQARRIADLIRSAGIDLVHHNQNPRGNRASVVAARLARVPQVCHVRTLTPYSWPLDRWLATWIDRFIYMSTAIETQCRAELKVPEEKGQVIYDPFHFDPFDKAAERAGAVRTELGIGRDEIVVSNVGRLVEWKGQDVFLQAMAPVVRSYPEVRVLLVGGPASNDASQAFHTRLKRLVAELGLSGRTIFTGFRRDVADLMAASDIIVHSSTTPEPFGRVVVEAMAVGRPIVATAAGGPLDIIRDGETGLLVPLRDPVAMADAIRALVTDPERARRIGERARADVRERFGLDRFTASIRRVYERTLNGAR